MMTMDDYTQITWPEVRKGDVLMHENGDRLMVQGFERVQIRTTAGLYAPSEYRASGFTPHRKVAPLPTEPGPYLDKDGVLCELIDGDKGPTWRVSAYNILLLSPDEAAVRAPFTRLVPMPTEEQVREAADSGLADRSEFAATAVTNAVMALLRGTATAAHGATDYTDGAQF